MTTIDSYMQDGACPAARAVLALLSNFDIEQSWSGKRYKAEINVARWENCREQGYVLSLRSENCRRQFNMAFFEHRNSDNICAIQWEQLTMNSPTIDTAEFGEQCYSNKWDVSHEFSYKEHYQMAECIQEQLTNFWLATVNKEKVSA